MFEEFEKSSHRKDRRRFRASLAGSSIICAGVFGSLIIASASARTAVQEEDLLQVEFALPDEPPPPPPVVAPAAVQPKPKPRKDELAAPEEIPDERAAEADGPLAEAAPVEDTAPVAEAAPAPAVVEAPPPPPPKPKPKAEGPVQLPEQATPPVAIAGNTPPEYPEEARKAGIQAVVIAKIVVRADGSVASVDILRGAEIFHAAVKAALMTWHYEPARLPDGTAISVFRIVQLPFKLENM